MTAHGGVPAPIEHFRRSGAAAAVDGSVPYRRRKRGLSAAEMCESLLALWASGGERCEGLDRLRAQDGLGPLPGHGLPAAQTAQDFLSCFEEPALPLLGGGRSAVREEGLGLRGLAQASPAAVAALQARAPQREATIDLDVTIVASSKRAASFCYDGRCGYQPVVALWAEQDVVVADGFRDGIVSASSGNQRVIERALAALPSQKLAPMRRGSASTWCCTTCCLRSSVLALRRSFIAFGRGGCVFWCSTPWPVWSAPPARDCCASPTASRALCWTASGCAFTPARRRSPPEATSLRRPPSHPARPGLRGTAHSPPVPSLRPSAPSRPIPGGRKAPPPPPKPPTRKLLNQKPPKTTNQRLTRGMRARLGA